VEVAERVRQRASDHPRAIRRPLERELPQDDIVARVPEDALAYMDQSGEGIDPPSGAIVELAKDIDAKHADVFSAADRLRSWRV
jgi:hypothetical protein